MIPGICARRMSSEGTSLGKTDRQSSRPGVEPDRFLSVMNASTPSSSSSTKRTDQPPEETSAAAPLKRPGQRFTVGRWSTPLLLSHVSPATRR